jgi:hypothetical protein
MRFIVALLVLAVIAACPVRYRTVEKVIYKPVPVNKACKLPELGKLPKVEMHPGPDGTRCLDLTNRKRLAERLSRLRQWVGQVKARCGGVPHADAGTGDAPSVPETSAGRKDVPGKGERGAVVDGGGS